MKLKAWVVREQICESAHEKNPHVIILRAIGTTSGVGQHIVISAAYLWLAPIEATEYFSK